MKSWIGYLVLPAAYVLVGKLNLLAAVPPGYATSIFLPAGFAILGTAKFGYGMLPGVWIGSFLLNIWVGQHWENFHGAAASAIASGSTLQAFVGSWLLRDFLSDSRDLLFAGGLAPFICLVSSTISLSLLIFVVGEHMTFGPSWIAWWSGDTLGLLISTMGYFYIRSFRELSNE